MVVRHGGLQGQPRTDAGDGAGQGSGATLIVFEEVDSLVDEDKGFLAALAGLVLDSKARPDTIYSCCAVML